MNEKRLKEMLKEGANTLGLELKSSQIEHFLAYLRELKLWNQRINLTSITGDEDIVVRHFLDSLTLCRLIKGTGLKTLTVLDIGSGAGFPGIPLKIAIPTLEVVLMDSTEKKVHFMRHIIRNLGLNTAAGKIEALVARAEDPTVVERFRAQFDIVTSRAFSRLRDLVDVSLPYAAPGGLIVAIKGPSSIEELKELEGMRGISRPEVEEITLPFADRKTVLVKMKRAV